MLEMVSKIAAWLDSSTGISGTTGYLLITFLAVMGYSWINGGGSKAAAEDRNGHDEDDDEPDPPRNFTPSQLRHFDGRDDPKTGEPKPVYLALHGIVFDVSGGRNFYGPGGPYEQFAGRECGVALAKMSFDETHLDDVAGCDNLNFGEKNELDGWIEKFQYYRCYPVLGRLVPESLLPNADRVLTKEELARNDGSGEAPKGYAAAPIYLGAGQKVYDVSFGGVHMYGTGTAYNRFAGKDASRALAKMSFDPADAENADVTDLSEKELGVLNDWIKTFQEKKGYPCVGRLDK